MSDECTQRLGESEAHKTTELFVHKFKQNGNELILKIPIPIPLETTVKELGYRISKCHSIACYNEDGEKFSLALFCCLLITCCLFSDTQTIHLAWLLSEPRSRVTSKSNVMRFLLSQRSYPQEIVFQWSLPLYVSVFPSYSLLLEHYLVRFFWLWPGI